MLLRDTTRTLCNKWNTSFLKKKFDYSKKQVKRLQNLQRELIQRPSGNNIYFARTHGLIVGRGGVFDLLWLDKVMIKLLLVIV